MRNIFDRLLWIGLFIFFVPTTLVMASWGSLPGDFMFPVKLALENILAAAVSPSYQVSGELQVKYTERRFSEASRLLAEKNSVVGLPYLTKQVEQTKIAIEKGSRSDEKQTLRAQYIVTLTQVSNQLEYQKQTLTATGPQGQAINPVVNQAPAAAPAVMPVNVVVSPVVVITPTPPARPNIDRQTVVTPMPTSAPTPNPKPTLLTVVSTNNGTVPPQNIIVAMQITQTQHKIKETIDELEKKDNQDSGSNENKPIENKPSVTPDTQNNKDNRNNDK